MKLTYEQIKSITRGAVRTEENNGRVSFSRFTEEQDEFYSRLDETKYQRSRTTAGIELNFRTNSKTLGIGISISYSGTRGYYAVDILSNNKKIGTVRNFTDAQMTQPYNRKEFPFFKTESRDYSLGDGDKEIRIVLPWSARAELRSLSVDDGAYVTPNVPEKTILTYGDSITQGYDAKSPSNRYTARLCEKLGVGEICKAVGGEIHRTEFAKYKDNVTPEFITVAYGTNDWAFRERDFVRENISGFYDNLTASYPDTLIFAITPVWRATNEPNENYGEFLQIRADIKQITSAYKNVVCIDGMDFIPHDINYFSEFVVHPTDAGFEYYADALYNEIIKIYKVK